MTVPAPAAAAERMSALDAEFFAEHLASAVALKKDGHTAEVVKQDLHLEEDGRITFRTKLELSFKYEHEHKH